MGLQADARWLGQLVRLRFEGGLLAAFAKHAEANAARHAGARVPDSTTSGSVLGPCNPAESSLRGCQDERNRHGRCRCERREYGCEHGALLKRTARYAVRLGLARAEADNVARRDRRSSAHARRKKPRLVVMVSEAEQRICRRLPQSPPSAARAIALRIWCNQQRTRRGFSAASEACTTTQSASW